MESKAKTLRHSLRGKVILGYYAVAAIILVASLFFISELRTLEKRVALGQRATDLFDTVLEIRRFERNFFLYHQPADRAENARYIAEARALLQNNARDFDAIAAPARISALRRWLDRYATQMAALPHTGDDLARMEPPVRSLGKEVVAIAEEMARAERQQIQKTLSAFQALLLIVIGVMALWIVLIGRILSQRIVRPLKEIEASVDALIAKRRVSLAAPSDDREIVSITNAFNHMLQELELRQKSLMRSERLASLGTMLSGVAHELNNPLSNISTSCQILQEELGDHDPATQRRYLEQIDQQTERARQIVRSLLDFSRDKVFKKEPVALKALVTQTVAFVRGAVSAKSITQIDIAEDLVVPADAQRLQQVFINLIGNALDVLGPDGRIRITARACEGEGPPAGTVLGLGCDVGGDAVEICVEDNGPGIAPDILPRIFDPFFTTKDVGHGMGLGLFIVYEIVDEHDGCIAVKSEAGQGTAFCIRLPRHDTPREKR